MGWGLEQGEFPMFVDMNVDPDYNATLDKFTWTIGLEGEGVSYDVVGGNVEFNYFMALTGSNRARSGGLSVDGREIDLGAQTLYTSPFGVGVNFVCKYPTTVSVTSEGFTVEGGCYSQALEVVAGDITSRSSKFSYKLFKGVGVNSVDQTLTCEAVIFKSSVSDPRPAADSDCPNQGNDSFFLYSAPVPRCNTEDC